MDPGLKIRLFLALGCMPDEYDSLETSAYIDHLSYEYSQDEAEIRNIYNCYIQSQNPLECLEPFAADLMTNGLPEACLKLGDLSFEEEFGESWESQYGANRFMFSAYDDLFGSDVYEKREDVREAVNDIISFHLERQPVSLYEDISSRLGLREEWPSRFSLYDSREVSQSPSNPTMCPNADQWEREDLSIPGLSYSIPIFLPKGYHRPPQFYEATFHTLFDIFSLLINPEYMDQLLHPAQEDADERPDLSIYIRTPPYDESAEGCGLINQTGGVEYLYNLNTRSIIVDYVFLDELYTVRTMSPVTNPWRVYLRREPFNALIHEVSHAIHEAFLEKTDYNSGLKGLYEFSVLQPDGGRYLPIPLYGGRRITRNEDGEIYSSTDHGEYFAEMVTEYIFYMLIPPHFLEDQPALRARRRIMEDFFRDGEVHPEAFSEENIEAAFSAEGIEYSSGDEFLEMRIGGSSIPRQIWEARSIWDGAISGGWVFTARGDLLPTPSILLTPSAPSSN